jgi:hypothetical protein
MRKRVKTNKTDVAWPTYQQRSNKWTTKYQEMVVRKSKDGCTTVLTDLMLMFIRLNHLKSTSGINGCWHPSIFCECWWTNTQWYFRSSLVMWKSGRLSSRHTEGRLRIATFWKAKTWNASESVSRIRLDPSSCRNKWKTPSNFQEFFRTWWRIWPWPLKTLGRNRISRAALWSGSCLNNFLNICVCSGVSTWCKSDRLM